MKRPADMDLAPSPSPEPESPSSPNSDLAGPPRKRARSDVTPEERREARAHRNRIAAQNSRDRRKAQFAYLERRVQELEEENQQLRAGMGLSQRSRSHEQRDEEREKDRARDQENEELRQRIKTLETGWEAVMKALAASGLPLNVPSAPSSSSSPSAVTSGHPPTTTFPVFVPPSPVFPISPAPSNHSSGSSTLFDSDDFDSTRHLARVATTDAPRLSSVSLQRAPLPADAPSRSRSQSFSEIQLAPAPSAAPVTQPTPTLPEIDWVGEVEMQKLLAMLPLAPQDATPLDAGSLIAPNDDFPSALELELSEWDLAGATSAPVGSMSSVSVF
uniref:X-box-binding protein 1 n=1 Tax=Ganoderma boninense TaxID=34458 RepID=A0A5K1JVG8_9APHY|nr:Thermoresistant gluconokinase (EC [Ganoderma boninense]